MATVTVLINRAEMEGLRLAPDGDHLVVDGPYRPNLLAELSGRKAEVLAALAERSRIYATADALIVESEGHRPPRNPSVHAMIDEARARLGSRDLEERSFTSWIKKNAPAVASCWPQAPLDAAWFDWRQHVDREHLEILDRALEALNPKSEKPKNRSEVT